MQHRDEIAVTVGIAWLLLCLVVVDLRTAGPVTSASWWIDARSALPASPQALIVRRFQAPAVNSDQRIPRAQPVTRRFGECRQGPGQSLSAAA